MPGKGTSIKIFFSFPMTYFIDENLVNNMYY